MHLEPASTIQSFKTYQNFFEVLSHTTVQNEEHLALSFFEGMEKAVEWMLQVRKEAKRIHLIGNGGSQSIASHLSVDLNKNADIASLAYTDPSLLTCLSNDFGYENVFAKAVQYYVQSGDLVVAISSSGQSKNIINGVLEAKRRHARVISFSGFQKQNPLYELGHLNFFVPSFSYGIVEIGHSLLLHAIVDEVVERKTLWS